MMGANEAKPFDSVVEYIGAEETSLKFRVGVRDCRFENKKLFELKDMGRFSQKKDMGRFLR